MTDVPKTPSESNSTDLPEAVEDEVLAILEGDDAVRDTALRDLLQRHAGHARTIRAWLTRAGVAVPAVVTTGGTVVEGEDLDALPTRIGRYLLQERIGRGGFGTVYRAEQQEPFRRPVAVKVLNPGMDSREILGRFSAEREALNRMDHPGIARLLDAGSTAAGRPFFVMELVEGASLATHCRQRGLGLRRRLELFLKVLDAMQHAHQKAVLHRDLSSNNVLVTEVDGQLQPKIIDFGIAKSMADPLLSGGARTFTGTMLGTPEFMSPEQAAGDVRDVDTRADVYALGVQLYELLTDQLPIPTHELRAQGIAGMAQIVRDYTPRPPSAAAVHRFADELEGDLDAITMRAIQKRRDERYATVAELATDIRAFLDHEPIRARPASRWYRFAKFVQRRRAESVAIAAVAIGLIATSGALWWALAVTNQALADAEAQKQQIEQRADAGFRLLANAEKLVAARATAAELPPPWPEHRAAFEAWLEDRGEPLVDELPQVRGKITELEERNSADIVDQHLESALRRLATSLDRFEHTTLRRVRSKLALLESLAAAADHDAAWDRAIVAVQHRYDGITLPRVPGLLPLGENPNTGLQEFLDLASHARGAPPPGRHPDSGELELTPRTGIVFVLVPGEGFRIGVAPSPGLPLFDPAAEPDEHDGDRMLLDPFLLAKTEVTKAQWARLTGDAPPPDDGAMLPIANLTWADARVLLRQFDLDLPTEAQWEFACRADAATGPGTEPSTAAAHLTLRFQASSPAPVASFPPNGFGLFDLRGNVAEWCLDEKLPYDQFAARDGDGLRRRLTERDATARVVRGGRFYDPLEKTRPTSRHAIPAETHNDGIGVRPIRRW